MTSRWEHVGRVWSNGGPYLVLDAGAALAWRGGTGDDVERLFGRPEQESLPVGGGTAVVVGDPVVRDDSWIEVLRGDDGAVCVVQVSAADHAGALRQALAHPVDDDEAVATIEVTSGRPVVLDPMSDGGGPAAARLLPAAPGPFPQVAGPPPPDLTPGLELVTGSTSCDVRGRWFTELEGLDGDCFARWLLLPRPADRQRSS